LQGDKNRPVTQLLSLKWLSGRYLWIYFETKSLVSMLKALYGYTVGLMVVLEC